MNEHHFFLVSLNESIIEISSLDQNPDKRRKAFQTAFSILAVSDLLTNDCSERQNAFERFIMVGVNDKWSEIRRDCARALKTHADKIPAVWLKQLSLKLVQMCTIPSLVSGSWKTVEGCLLCLRSFVESINAFSDLQASAIGCLFPEGNSPSGFPEFAMQCYAACYVAVLNDQPAVRTASLSVVKALLLVYDAQEDRTAFALHILSQCCTELKSHSYDFQVAGILTLCQEVCSVFSGPHLSPCCEKLAFVLSDPYLLSHPASIVRQALAGLWIRVVNLHSPEKSLHLLSVLNDLWPASDAALVKNGNSQVNNAESTMSTVEEASMSPLAVAKPFLAENTSCNVADTVLQQEPSWVDNSQIPLTFGDQRNEFGGHSVGPSSMDAVLVQISSQKLKDESNEEGANNEMQVCSIKETREDSHILNSTVSDSAETFNGSSSSSSAFMENSQTWHLKETLLIAFEGILSAVVCANLNHISEQKESLQEAADFPFLFEQLNANLDLFARFKRVLFFLVLKVVTCISASQFELRRMAMQLVPTLGMCLFWLNPLLLGEISSILMITNTHPPEDPGRVACELVITVVRHARHIMEIQRENNCYTDNSSVASSGALFILRRCSWGGSYTGIGDCTSAQNSSAAILKGAMNLKITESLLSRLGTVLKNMHKLFHQVAYDALKMQVVVPGLIELFILLRSFNYGQETCLPIEKKSTKKDKKDVWNCWDIQFCAAQLAMLHSLAYPDATFPSILPDLIPVGIPSLCPPCSLSVVWDISAENLRAIAVSIDRQLSAGILKALPEAMESVQCTHCELFAPFLCYWLSLEDKPRWIKHQGADSARMYLYLALERIFAKENKHAQHSRLVCSSYFEMIYKNKFPKGWPVSNCLSAAVLDSLCNSLKPELHSPLASICFVLCIAFQICRNLNEIPISLVKISNAICAFLGSCPATIEAFKHHKLQCEIQNQHPTASSLYRELLSTSIFGMLQCASLNSEADSDWDDEVETEIDNKAFTPQNVEYYFSVFFQAMFYHRFVEVLRNMNAAGSQVFHLQVDMAQKNFEFASFNSHFNSGPVNAKIDTSMYVGQAASKIENEHSESFDQNCLVLLQKLYEHCHIFNKCVLKEDNLN